MSPQDFLEAEKILARELALIRGALEEAAILCDENGYTVQGARIRSLDPQTIRQGVKG